MQEKIQAFLTKLTNLILKFWGNCIKKRIIAQHKIVIIREI